MLSNDKLEMINENVPKERAMLDILNKNIPEYHFIKHLKYADDFMICLRDGNKWIESGVFIEYETSTKAARMNQGKGDYYWYDGVFHWNISRKGVQFPARRGNPDKNWSVLIKSDYEMLGFVSIVRDFFNTITDFEYMDSVQRLHGREVRSSEYRDSKENFWYQVKEYKFKKRAEDTPLYGEDAMIIQPMKNIRCIKNQIEIALCQHFPI